MVEQGGMNSEAGTILALTLSPGVGNVTINRLTSWADAAGRSLSELMHLPKRDLLEMVPADLHPGADALSKCAEHYVDRASTMIERVEKAGGQALVGTDEDFPEGLKASLETAAPPLLFVVGNIGLIEADAAGIVGTRSPCEEGVRLAEQCAQVFSERGVPVISGGAEGVDTAAHFAALDAGGTTVVVLAQGLLSYRGPKELLDAVEEGRALLISQFSPDAPWSTHGALTRNATIAALSRLVCVIEPGRTGGSVRTARHALEQGKNVMAYTRPEDEGVMRQLERLGARRLLGEDGRFSRARVVEAWEAQGRSRARQSEMF